MLVLHTSAWRTGTPDTPLHLCLWAESTDAAAPTPESGRGAAHHPFGARASSIVDALRTLESLLDFRASARQDTIVLRLPSTVRAPLPSPELAHLQLSDAGKPRHVSPWRVECQTFAPLAAL